MGIQSDQQLSRITEVPNAHEKGGMGDFPDVTGVFTTDTIFKSRDALVKWAKQKGAEIGMVVVIVKSDSSKSSRKTPRLYLSCERQGKYKPGKTSRWKNINCPFMLRGCYAKPEDIWTLKVICGHHNHALSTNMSASAQKKQKVIDKNIEKYWGKVPRFFKPFVEEIEEIDRDGNCGFRAFAKGLWSDESKWEEVRKGCVEELNEFVDVYEKMFGGSEAIKDLRGRMDHFTSPCRRKHWMIMPEVGFLVASRYDVVVVHISVVGVSTILPLHSWPPMGELQVIATEFVDDNHSVFVKLFENALLPRPMSLWEKHKHGCASGWESRLSARMEAYDIVSMVDKIESSPVHVVD